MKKRLSLSLLSVLIIAAASAFAQQVKTDYQKIGESLYADKDYKGAVDNFTRAINVNKQNKIKLAQLYDKRAQAQTDLEQYQKAIQDENAAILANPGFADAYWNRGVAYSNNGDYQLAIDDYNRTMSFYKDDKDNLSTLFDNRGINQRKLKNYKKAIEDHSQAILLNRKNGDAYWHRGIAYNNNGDYQLAVDDYTTAMFYNQEDVKDLAILYKNRGVNKRLLKQYKEAINDFNTGIHLNPQNGGIYWERGLAYQHNGDYQLAINDYTEAMPFYQDDKGNLAILYDNRSGNEIALRQPQKAIEDITSAIALDPQRGHLYWSRGIVYSQTGECKLAIDDYTKTMDFYKSNKPALAILHHNNAENLYILNENQKVIDECTAAIALNPNLASPYFTRGKIYLKRIVNKEQAVKDFNKVIELDTAKSSVSYIFSQFYTGHTDQALQMLQQQVLSTPNPDDVLTHYYNIACMFSIMNKPDEANIYLKRAIDSGYSKKFAANDEDFDNIRKTPDYIAMMADGSSK
ncbi:tetratricopeptide repeat protein [Mucilaginibacter sp. SP1R1]|uniref:tetratricopeptide repeat protein n=1 Tax=Mucilaginibacter sp. SP1R1 TaxID=2723091 RepID=UPI0016091BA0|nr:tetratricopeptide repeat protein [Mucilaginibacter sp. SP1R1]MBB6152523.1 tetratricopeptide (TPR) repeat protein [Mucilaginibacter sp. SP1R1]